MDRTIMDIMSNDPKRVEDFKTACDQLLATQYILAESRIGGILETIAVSKTLYDMFDGVLRDFDYKQSALEFKASGFRLPEQPQRIAALIFCILLDIDKKNIMLGDFLPYFSAGTDINSAYDNFLAKLILPFKNAVMYLASDNRPRQPVNKAVEKTEISKLAKFEKLMGTLIARIQSDALINEIVKDDIVQLSTDLINLVHQGNTKSAQKVYDKLHKKIKVNKFVLLDEFEKIEF